MSSSDTEIARTVLARRISEVDEVMAELRGRRQSWVELLEELDVPVRQIHKSDRWDKRVSRAEVAPIIPVRTPRPTASGPNRGKHGSQLPAIYEALSQAGDEGLTPAEVTKILRDKGLTVADSSVSARFSRMFEEGVLTTSAHSYRRILKPEFRVHVGEGQQKPQETALKPTPGGTYTAANLGVNGPQYKAIMKILQDAGNFGVTSKEALGILHTRGFKSVSAGSVSGRFSLMKGVGIINTVNGRHILNRRKAT